MGKSQVVADYFNDFVAKSEFDAAFRDHRFKAAYVNRYVKIPANWEEDEWFIIYDSKSQNHHSRQHSLYVEAHVDHSPRSPSQMISLDTAKELLAIGKRYLLEIRKGEYLTEHIGTKALNK